MKRRVLVWLRERLESLRETIGHWIDRLPARKYPGPVITNEMIAREAVRLSSNRNAFLSKIAEEYDYNTNATRGRR